MPPQNSSTSSRAVTPAGAGTAAKVKLAVVGEAGLLDLGELLRQQQPHLGVFVADIDVGLAGVDHPGGDQHALDEPVRIALEIVAVLERARLAFVGIDRK